MSTRYVIILFALCVPTATLAEVIVYDHFDDGILDPVWEITFNEYVCDWTYAEQVSELHVTEICNSGEPNDWAIVSLAQPCPVPSDFYVAWKLAWDSHTMFDTMQVL